MAEETSLNLAAGTFETSIAEFRVGAVHPLLGAPLEIRLVSDGDQVYFDDIRLSRSFDNARLDLSALTIDPTSGRVEWIPTSDQIGRQVLAVAADDGRGGVAVQEFVVNVRREIGDHDPVIVSEPPTQHVRGEIAPGSSMGTEFWLTFPANIHEGRIGGDPSLSLLISSPEGATGTVEIPALGFSEGFVINSGDTVVVHLPAGGHNRSDGIFDNGIHVAASQRVTVSGYNYFLGSGSEDTFLGIPTDAIGIDYLVMSYGGSYSQFAIVATVNDTSVTVTVPGENEQAYVLDAGQVLHQSRNRGDVTGTSITSDKPVSVFGSNDATYVGSGGCCTDHLVEQLPPTSSWGTEFLSIPLASRIGGDTFRMLAATDGTILSVNGATVATLSRGEFHEQNIDQPAHISSNSPIAVAQFSNSFSFDGITGDASMILTPPVTEFDTSYVFEVPDPRDSDGESHSYDEYINVVAPWATVRQHSARWTPATSGRLRPHCGLRFCRRSVRGSAGTSSTASPRWHFRNPVWIYTKSGWLRGAARWVFSNRALVRI